MRRNMIVDRLLVFDPTILRLYETGFWRGFCDTHHVSGSPLAILEPFRLS
jgi:hypothetical protein